MQFRGDFFNLYTCLKLSELSLGSGIIFHKHKSTAPIFSSNSLKQVNESKISNYSDDDGASYYHCVDLQFDVTDKRYM